MGNIMKEKIYVYKKANAMTDHKYTDDVAITMAANKKDALIKFEQYYNCNIEDIEEVNFNAGEVAILTDY